MNEYLKSAIYVAAAALICLIAVLARPGSDAVNPHDMEGKPLFAGLTETNQVTEISIARYNDDEGVLERIEVIKEESGWVLPGYANYAAEKQRKITEVAGSLIGAKILKFVSDELGDHRDLGVIAPTKEQIIENDTGIGMRVSLGNGGEEQFALIIGNEVKNDAPNTETLYYVRLDGESNVYQAKVDLLVYTTKLNDWIDENLLDIGFGKIKQIELQDYSMLVQRHRVEDIEYRSQITAEADGTNWKLVNYERFSPDQRKFVPAKLADDEELDSTPLGDLESALGDLNIVDVKRKPEQIAKDLREGEPMQADQTSRKTLADKGFHLLRVSRTAYSLYSDEGEVVIRTEDGVEYTLRFGQMAGVGKEVTESSSAEKKEKTDADGGKKTDEDESRLGIHRYLFVMARFDQDMIERPEMPEVLKNKAPPADDVKKAAPDAKKPEVKKPEVIDSKVKDKEKQPAGDGDPSKDEAIDKAAKETTTKDAANKDDTKKDDTAKPKPAGDAKADKTDEAKDKEREKQDEEAAKERAEADRKRAERQYKTQLEEYEKKLIDGREKVRKLNERFADWFYVIPEKTYKSIRLRAEDVIKKKEIKKETTDEPGPGGPSEFPDFKNLLPKLPGK